VTPTVELGLRPKGNHRHGEYADSWSYADGHFHYADRRYTDGVKPMAIVGTPIHRQLLPLRRRLVAVGT
jgi:hypothetical protein